MQIYISIQRFARKSIHWRAPHYLVRSLQSRNFVCFIFSHLFSCQKSDHFCTEICMEIHLLESFLIVGLLYPISTLCQFFICIFSLLVFLITPKVFGKQSIEWRTSCSMVRSFPSGNFVFLCGFCKIVCVLTNELDHRYLNSNQFTGELPDAWSTLSNLRDVYVFHFCVSTSH